MKHIITIILAFLLSVSTCQKKQDVNVDQTMVVQEDTLTRTQLDSVFIVDGLSQDLEQDWITSSVLSGDRSDLLYKYVFIKELTDSTQYVYTLYGYQDTLFILNKRIVE
jgi:hypothetical protein